MKVNLSCKTKKTTCKQLLEASKHIFASALK